MREILFRGKTKGTMFTESKWVEGFYYVYKGKYAGSDKIDFEHPTITTGIVECSGGYGERSERIESKVIPETVGQYTGLTDKNGKKIFEGDIVNVNTNKDTLCHRYEGRNLVIRFDEYHRFVASGRLEYPLCNHYEYEVIGNIHDNPELMEGVQEDENEKE